MVVIYFSNHWEETIDWQHFVALKVFNSANYCVNHTFFINKVRPSSRSKTYFVYVELDRVSSVLGSYFTMTQHKGTVLGWILLWQPTTQVLSIKMTRRKMLHNSYHGRIWYVIFILQKNLDSNIRVFCFLPNILVKFCWQSYSQSTVKK